MKLAVCLFKFFPYGGLARDFMRIMQACLETGDHLDVYVMEWQGEVPDDMHVHIIPVSGFSNHARLASYIRQVQSALHESDHDLVIGFNKIPGLDLYYAADPCYIDRVRANPLYGVMKYTPRVRFYSECERAVFGVESTTVSLMISDVQQALFKQHYQTPDARLYSLPPGIDPSRKRPGNATEIRQQTRTKAGLKDDEWLLLMVGTGFKTKGVDRAIAALSALPDSHRNKVKLFILGEGEPAGLLRQAKKAGVAEQIRFLGGRSDVQDFLLAADLLIHPARKENTGTVILEAIVAGLPVLVSDVCGYAKHVLHAQAGELLEQPDNASRTAAQIAGMLATSSLKRWSEQALNYAETEDLYSMPDKAAQIIRQMAANRLEEKT